MTISNTRLANFRDLLQAAMDRYMRIKFPILDSVDVSFGGGRKYMKIIKSSGDSHCIWGFVALVDAPEKGVTAGDVLMPASYNAPALNGARGSILDKDIISMVGPYGPAYKNSLANWEGVDVSDLVLAD